MNIKTLVGVGWAIVGACLIFGVVPSITIEDIAGLVCFAISYQLLK